MTITGCVNEAAAIPRLAVNTLAAPARVVLNVTKCSVAYRNSGPERPWLLEQLDLTVHSGETVAIVAPSGSGKSTLAKVLLGLLPRQATIAEESRLTLCGEVIALQAMRENADWRGRRISYVAQAPSEALHPLMRIGNQALLVGRRHGWETPRIASRLEELRLSFGMNDVPDLARRYPHELSGGQQQRVLLMLGLLLSPDILVADEPTSALDPVARASVLADLQRHQRSTGMACILMTHDIDLAVAWGDRVLTFARGRLAPFSTTLSSVETIVSQRTGEAPTHDVLLTMRGVSVTTPTPWRWGRSKTPPRCRVSNLDLTLRRGEWVALMGASGAGKSSVSAIVAGLLQPTHGRVLFLGKDLDLLQHRTMEERQRIQYLAQEPGRTLSPAWTVEAVVGEGLQHNGTSAERRQRISAVLTDVGLPPSEYANRIVRTLSGGQQQRIALARALVVSPHILVCDESVSSLDEASAHEILALVKRCARDKGIAVLATSHNVRHIARFADRVIVMQHGACVESGSVADVLLQPQQSLTQQFLNASSTTQATS